jgi:hypothetical protein
MQWLAFGVRATCRRFPSHRLVDDNMSTSIIDKLMIRKSGDKSQALQKQHLHKIVGE